MLLVSNYCISVCEIFTRSSQECWVGKTVFLSFYARFNHICMRDSSVYKFLRENQDVIYV